MNISEEQIESIRSGMAQRFGGISLTPQEIGQIAANFDDSEARETAKSSFRIEKWDKQTPINGVSAEVVLEGRDELQDGVVYLIYQGNSVLYIQPWAPGLEGTEWLTDENWKEYADKHLDAVVEDSVMAQFSTILQDAFVAKVQKG